MANILDQDPQAPLEEVVVSANRVVRDSNVESLERFMSQDFLKSSQFLFKLYDAPFNYPGISGNKFRDFSLLCESVEFPGKTINAVDYKIPGYDKIRVPFSKEYNEVTFTFLHNLEIPIYDFFSTWIDTISGRNTTTENRYFDDITVNFELYQFTELAAGKFKTLNGLSNILNAIDKLNTKLFDSSKLFKATDLSQTFVNRVNAATNKTIDRTEYYKVKFFSAYPVTVASMPANWSDDTFQRLSVTWAYKNYFINDRDYELLELTDNFESVNAMNNRNDTFKIDPIILRDVSLPDRLK
jgi:hypothetical protein